MSSQSDAGAPKGAELRYASAPSWLGLILVAASPRGIRWAALGDSEPELIQQLHAAHPGARAVPAGASAAVFLAELCALAEDPHSLAAPPLDPVGTPFQQAVWEALRQIPPGSTRSYSQLALEIGQPRAVRAVGAACAANTIALLIPCHRAVRSDGTLGGFRWGLARKRARLDQESGRPSLPMC